MSKSFEEMKEELGKQEVTITADAMADAVSKEIHEMLEGNFDVDIMLLLTIFSAGLMSRIFKDKPKEEN